MHLRRCGGLTLIELLITIAVAAVLLGIAAPSFTALIENNRAANAANELLGSLQHARSEAVKRARTVRLCPSADGASCVDGTDWGAGWIVSFDEAGASVVLRVVGAFPAGVAITGPAQQAFEAAGNAAAASFAIGVGAATVRNVCTEASGRSEVRKGEDC